MVRVKGMVFANARAFVETRFGAARWAELVAQMDPQDAETLRSVAATGWYDFELQVRLFRCMVGAFSGGDDALIEAFAQFEAERDITLTYRLFFRLANPGLVLEKATSYWHRFYSVGHWAVERPSASAASGTLMEFPAREPLFCTHLTAYLTRMFELVGARALRLEHSRCHLRGDRACVFTATWRE